ncbi:MAG: protein kinase [Parachlamydiaceae bacterium]
MDSHVRGPGEINVRYIKDLLLGSTVNENSLTFEINDGDYCNIMSKIFNFSTTEDLKSISLEQYEVQQILDSPTMGFSPTEKEEVLNKFLPTVEKVKDAGELVLSVPVPSTESLYIASKQTSVWQRLVNKFFLPSQIEKQIKKSLELALRSKDVKFSDKDVNTLALAICRIVNDRNVRGSKDEINLRSGTSRGIDIGQKILSVDFKKTPKGEFEMTINHDDSSKCNCWIEMLDENQVKVTIDINMPLAEGSFKKVFFAISFLLDPIKKDRDMHSERNVVARFREKLDEGELATNRALYAIAPAVIAHPSRPFLPDPQGLVDSKVTTGIYLGRDLETVMKEDLYTPEQMWSKFIPLWMGLELIHQNNWVHRDIKPANILVPENGVFVFVDFGFSQKIGRSSFIQEYSCWDLASRVGLVLPFTDVYGLVMTMCRKYFKDFKSHLLGMESPLELTIYSQNETIKEFYENISAQKDLSDYFKSDSSILKVYVPDPEIKQNRESFKLSINRIAIDISNKFKNIQDVNKQIKDSVDKKSKKYVTLKENYRTLLTGMETLINRRIAIYSLFHEKQAETDKRILHTVLDLQDESLGLLDKKISEKLLDDKLTVEQKKSLLSAKIIFLMQKTMTSILRKLRDDNDEIFTYIKGKLAGLKPGDELALSKEISEELKPINAADVQNLLQNTQDQMNELNSQITALKSKQKKRKPFTEPP